MPASCAQRRSGASLGCPGPLEAGRPGSDPERSSCDVVISARTAISQVWGATLAYVCAHAAPVPRNLPRRDVGRCAP